MPLADFEDLVRAGTIGPETPVRVEPRAPWVAAGTLGFYNDLRGGAEMAVRRALAEPAIPWMTALIVGTLVRIHFWVLGQQKADLVEALSQWAPGIRERGELWRLFTYGLLHGDFGHIASNAMLLAVIGITLESVIGPAGIAVLYLVSVVSGGLLSMAFGRDQMAIGASAGDFGFLAAAVVFGWRYQEMIPASARARFGGVILGYLLYGFLGGLLNERVDNLGHLGGILAGGVLMLALKPNLNAAWKRQNRRVLAGALVLTGAVLLGTSLRPLPTEPAEADGIRSVRPVGWEDGWLPAGERGWLSPTGLGAVVIRTTHGAGPVRLAATTDALVEGYLELDPSAVVAVRAPLTVDGVGGERVTLRYAGKDGARTVDAAIFVRGSYAHLALLDRSDAALAALVPPIVESVRLEPVTAEGEWSASDTSIAGLLERARIAADVGRTDEARALLAAARAAGPGEAAPVQVLLELGARWGFPDSAADAEAALVAFPEDRAVTVAAVRALAASGRAERARAVLDAARAAAPKDRRYERLSRELDEEP